MRATSLLVVLLSACSGGEEAPAAPAAPTSAVPAELLATTWQVRFAVDAARAPFEGRASWVGYFQGKRAEPLGALAAENDPVALARLHAEYAGIYRQAARMAAGATREVYGVDAQPTDPAETVYLLGVSGALLGDEAWRARLGSSAKSRVEGLAARDAAWKAWAESGAAWPPDETAAGSPGAPGPVVAGQAPDGGSVPHYALPESGVDTRVSAADPGTFWALARWHEAAAAAASPESAAAVRVWIDPWRLPPEPREPTAGAVIPDAFLFMSVHTTPGDALLLSDLARDGASAVAAHVSDSPYAAALAACTRDARLDVDCVLDQSSALASAVEAGMAKAAGKEDGFHRAFADLARAGLLRAADRAAEQMGQTEDSLLLRVNALDRSTGAARDPLFLLSVAAWDAGNRNSVRAEELVHGLLTEVPGLEAARLPLDALHIRLSRNAAPGRPMH